ncbi:alpha,alpha-trehalose-phosphate synthase (UDP-forming) [Ancylobacter dichloromethanicus]|uniref:Trehalose-6-phosphate synthase n=1 Tax=Ancylobacter dichloromethanicus TaxID=518825 RepID=A0A9W6J5A2_9HYPH|nr:alpha,alpha-trehalose-phosphate synthase (UDP-forming) [Ancylobacter dichloromethanicus]MBS7553875.1 alpha,alpha-trehalose-phosphate synthase (UDP-forming) [Ancylobacter dichloromethanicus]GLK70982.1 trehalose-6-phosphate synthase [Ancylobacter dichloromethanicus]
MARLVIVSNRVASPKERAAKAGGLAVALREALGQRGGLWFGWSGETVVNPPDTPKIFRSGRVTYALLTLDPEDQRAHYAGYANGTLWPLCHYRLGLLTFRKADWEGYRRVNEHFARALLPLLKPDDIIWVHDYHFIPLAAELRKLGFEGRIGYFHHIPWPTPEVYLSLPSHAALVNDLSHYDLVGLQTENDVRALLTYISSEVRGWIAPGGTVGLRDRRFRVAAYPIGIDAEAFVRDARKSVGSDEERRLDESLAGRTLAVGVDRLDYSKGLPGKFAAFGELLRGYPEHRSTVTMMQVAPLSRSEVAEYQSLRRELEELAGAINGEFAEFDWVPLRYLNRPFQRATLAAIYRRSRVGVVTPLRDGMNLVAKEYVAAQDPENPGVLVLSRFAGAADEMKGSLLVNPYDIEGMADAMHRALAMPLEERRERWRTNMDRVENNTIHHWCERFIDELTHVADHFGETPEPRANARPL